MAPVLTTGRIGDRVMCDPVARPAAPDLSSSYVFSDTSEAEGARLRLLASLLDPMHQVSLLATDLSPKARCLEVGAGAGTISCWLSGRLGPGGRVTATDIDLSHLAGPAADNMAVSRLDVITDPIPERSFDLITTRALLHHLPSWPDVIAKLRAALRPGGYLVLMEPDIGAGITAGTNCDEALRRFWAGWNLWGRSAGIDYQLAHRLPGHVRTAGFTVEEASQRIPFYNGGSAWAEFYLRTLCALPQLTDSIGPELVEVFRRTHTHHGTWTCSFGWVSVTARAR
jgi:SAM-dependent methyltransferase